MPITKNYKSLIFAGRGVKSIAFAGGLQVLESQDILCGIENVAGYSSGAMMATLIALNYKTEEVTDLILNTNFKKFADGYNPFRILTSYGIYKGKNIKLWIEKLMVNAGLPKDATFQMMSTYPKFKVLRLFATDINTKNIQEFSFEKSPNTIISEAVRASISAPFLFKAWKFSNKHPNDHMYIDTLSSFVSPHYISENQSDTLGFYLASPNKNTNTELMHTFSLKTYMMSIFNTFANSQNIVLNETKEFKQSIIINDLNVQASNLELSNSMKIKLISKGKEATEKFLGINRLFE